MKVVWRWFHHNAKYGSLSLISLASPQNTAGGDPAKRRTVCQSVPRMPLGAGLWHRKAPALVKIGKYDVWLYRFKDFQGMLFWICWRFRKSWGYPQLLPILDWDFLWKKNHPAGDSPSMEKKPGISDPLDIWAPRAPNTACDQCGSIIQQVHGEVPDIRDPLTVAPWRASRFWTGNAWGCRPKSHEEPPQLETIQQIIQQNSTVSAAKMKHGTMRKLPLLQTNSYENPARAMKNALSQCSDESQHVATVRCAEARAIQRWVEPLERSLWNFLISVNSEKCLWVSRCPNYPTISRKLSVGLSKLILLDN
jgi:hypothetical protein